MKLIYAACLTVLLPALAPTLAHAAPPECYDVAVALLSSFQSDAHEAYLPTGAKVCVAAKNVQPEDDSTLIAKGQFKISITNAAGKRVARYDATVRRSDAGLGTAYAVYATSVEELNKRDNGDYANAIEFRMRNDRIPRGDYAGRLSIYGTELTLIAR